MEKAGEISYFKKENGVRREEAVKKVMYMSRRFREAGVCDLVKELHIISGERSAFANWGVVAKIPTFFKDNASLAWHRHALRLPGGQVRLLRGIAHFANLWCVHRLRRLPCRGEVGRQDLVDVQSLRGH